MTASESQTRRLSAVMFLDVVGYSALMSKDEARALGLVKAMEAILREEVEARSGRVVKLMGDGSLSEFPSAKEALAAALRIQERVAERNRAVPGGDALRVRIGLHSGELIEEARDIFGDAVNIAARVQPLADPGGIAMTESFRAQTINLMPVRGRLEAGVKLKNIPGKNRIFLVPPEGARLGLWALRRRARASWRKSLVAAILLLAVVAGAWLITRRHALTLLPNRISMVQVRAAAKGPQALAVAEEVAEAADFKGAGLKGVTWMTRHAVLTLFAEAGITDLTVFEKPDRRACEAARKGGLDYTMAGRIIKGDKKRWKMETYVICMRTLEVVGAFTEEGDSGEELTAGTMRQAQEWIDDTFY